MSKKPKKPKNQAKPKQAAPGAAPAASANRTKKKVLHIGCGAPNPAKLHKNFRNGEWQEVRVDIDPNVKPDIVADMTDMHMIPAESAEAIWSSHNIEHLHFHQIPKALAEFQRVLKNGGFLFITLPDLQAVAEAVAEGKLEETLYESPAGPIMALDIIYGFTRSIARGNHFMAHKTGFTAATLANKFKAAGFCNIQVRRDGWDLWGVAYKLPKNHPNRVDQNVIIDPKVRTPLPGQRTNLTDELDSPPVTWAPLGLSQKK